MRYIGLDAKVVKSVKRSTSKRTRETKSPTNFPIVGIGASAGGLEAFMKLLKHMPTDTGMAFVLVQHLDPKHESALANLLGRATSMPVREVANDVPIMPNHVYVIPPNSLLSITQGKLKLQARPATSAPTRVIDSFFESLAQDQRERAIGVVLSGAATDGTLGLEAIKAEGGITFAQDDSAKYDSMPRSAIAAGCVDYVFSPESIAKELARIARHPGIAWRPFKLDPTQGNQVSRKMRDDDEAAFLSGGHKIPITKAKRARGEVDAPHAAVADNGFKKILLLLRNYSGVDFSLYKFATLQRRINRRIILSKQETLEGYAELLRGDPKELEALYSDVLISVTSFFRNADAFDTLKRKVIPKIFQQRKSEPIRVWVLGCSTGQEAYSIAMAITEVAEKTSHARKLQVFATDVNEALLKKARQGLYAKTLVQDISPERLRKFFIEEDAGYRIVKQLRESIVFARQNLITDPPFSKMDLISCRNLMIYLTPSLQKSIIPTFHYALKPAGYLFLGASESVGGFTNLFQPMDKKQKIYSKKAGTMGAALLPVKRKRGEPTSSGVHATPLSRDQRAAGRAAGQRGELSPQHEADRVTVSQYSPPGVLINANMQILQFRGQTGTYLQLPPTGKANFDVLKMARKGLMLPLRSAINQAKKEGKTARKENIAIEENGEMRAVSIVVVPLLNLEERCFLILFEGVKPSSGPARPRHAARKHEESRRNVELERELYEMQDYLQSLREQHEATSEELQASSEEVQSANEELQSTNEELETSKEELESTNEELVTINEEMAARNSELSQLLADLGNLQVSIRLPIVLLGRDLIIRRFNSAAEKVFNFVASDLGRHISDVRHNLVAGSQGVQVGFPSEAKPVRGTPDPHGGPQMTRTGFGAPDAGWNEPFPLEDLLREVIEAEREQEREVRDKGGRWYSLRARPYITLDNKVDGAVLVLVDIDALKRSVQESAAFREYAEAIIRTARDSIIVLRADFHVNTANEAFYRTFNTTPGQIVDRSVFEICDGQWDIPKLRSLLRDILPKDVFFSDFEVTRDVPDMGQRTMLLNARRLDMKDGEMPMILLAIEDVTERMKLQAAMRTSEMRYRRLFESARDGVIVIDFVSQKIANANPVILELLGYTLSELLGQELWQVGILADEHSSRGLFRELKRKDVVQVGDLELKTKAGGRCEVEIIANRYEEGGKQVVQYNIRDITARKQVERALHESAREIQRARDYAESILRTSPVPLLVLEEDLRVQAGNDAFYETFHVKPAQTEGRHVYELGNGEWSVPRMRELLEDILPRQRSLRDFEITHEFENIGRRTILINARRMENEAGAPERIVMVLEDITERKRGEEALRQAKDALADEAGVLERLVVERTTELTEMNDQLKAFVYSIAHDLRAPLRAMEGFSAMLVEEAGATLSDAGKHYAVRINKSAQFMDALLNDLLTFSQVSQRRVELIAVDPEKVVESIVSRLQEEIQERNARIDRAGPWPAVMAHEPTLTQVLFNLVSNALKFSALDIPPVVRLRAERRGEFIRLWVEDNGIGIAPEYQDQIFRLFTRLQGEKYVGTGIGLAIVQKGIERMGGRVGLESTPGQGSRFWCELRKAPEI